MNNLLRSITASIFLGLSVAQVNAQVPDGNAIAPKPQAIEETSQEVLKIQLGSIYESIKRKTQEEAQITTFLEIVQSAKKKLEAPTRLNTSTLEDVRQTFQRFKQDWTNNKEADIPSSLKDFARAMSRIEDEITSPTDNAIQELNYVVSPSEFGNRGATSSLPDYVQSKVRELLRADNRYEDRLARIPNIKILINAAYQYLGAQRTGQEQKIDSALLPGGSSPLPISGAESEIKDILPSEFEESANDHREATFQSLKNIEVSVSDILEKLKKSIAVDKEEVIKLDSKLKHKEDTVAGRANKVSGSLVYIFSGIMVTILFTLIILRVKGDDLSFLMIRERTAVEMLSIGMFLVTVLFLGAGDFIEKSTLGTLLGTLGGYLFTRRASQVNAQSASGQDEDPTELPLQPAAPTLDKESNKLKVPALGVNADYVALTAREVGTQTSIFLGVVQGAEFDLANSSLAKGTYELRLTAYNSDGASVPSKPVIFTKI